VAVLGYTFVMNIVTDLGTPYSGYAQSDLALLGWSLLPVAFVLALVLSRREATYGFVRQN
jgi:NSS family neurotransmitter:Na+ symporter